MTQAEQILRELRRGPLTAADAIHRLNIYRLAARIGELRDAGHQIFSLRVDQGGKKFAKYKLVREAR